MNGPTWRWCHLCTVRVPVVSWNWHRFDPAHQQRVRELYETKVQVNTVASQMLRST